MQKEVAAEVQQAVDNYLATEPQGPEAMFDYLYAELPARTLEQREYAIKLAQAKGAK
jgi:pyruvate dehydrogenase E1 component alpha subunit